MQIVRMHQPPSDERVATQGRPTCVGDYRGARTAMTIRTRRRAIEVEIQADKAIAVRENGALLWRRDDIGSHRPVDGIQACSSDGWGVVVAGHFIEGHHVFDLFSGKRRGVGDVRAYAADLTFALVPPTPSYRDRAYRWSRTFRVLTDGSRRPYAIDTPAVPFEWPGWDRPTVAITGDSRRYAVVSPSELGVYRAADDVQVARMSAPPYTLAERLGEVETELHFSVSGEHLVLRRDTREIWYRLIRSN